MVSEVDFAWAAGFIDGEGSFTVQKTKYKDKEYLYKRISAPQINREPLDRLSKILGGKVYGPYDNSRFIRGSKVLYSWVIINQKEFDSAVANISKYLSSIKLEQLTKVIERVHGGERPDKPPPLSEESKRG